MLGWLLPPSPPAKKATTRQDQARQSSTGDRPRHACDGIRLRQHRASNITQHATRSDAGCDGEYFRYRERMVGMVALKVGNTVPGAFHICEPINVPPPTM